MLHQMFMPHLVHVFIHIEIICLVLFHVNHFFLIFPDGLKQKKTNSLNIKFNACIFFHVWSKHRQQHQMRSVLAN